MARHLLFVILMIFSHKIQVQALPPPTLRVNTAVISETDSVSLRCQAPASASAYQCYFYTGEQQSIKGPSCLQTLTGTELLLMSSLSLPAEIKVRCFYTVKYEAVNSPSPHSNPLSITIQSQKPEMSVAHLDGEYVLIVCSLPGSVKDDTRCNLYFGEAIHPALHQTVMKKSSSKTKQRFCQFYVPVADVLRHLHFVQEKDASCDYSLESEASSLSSRSDRYNLKADPNSTSSIAFTSATSLSSSSESSPNKPSTTPSPSTATSSVTSLSGTANISPTIYITSADKKTEDMTSGRRITVGHTSEKPATKANPGTWELTVVLAVVGFGVTVGIILLILKLLRNKRRAERYSPMWTKANTTDDFVCMTNIEHGATLRQSNDGTYSVITSVPGVRCTNGAEKQNRQEIKHEDSDIYHLYGTISEEPAAPASQDMIYNMLQAH